MRSSSIAAAGCVSRIRPELGSPDLVGRHLTPRDDGRPAHLTGVVDRRQLADEVALVAHPEQRLPAVLGRAEDLDGSARDQHDVVGAITLGEQHAARRIATRAAEGDQIVPVLCAEARQHSARPHGREP